MKTAISVPDILFQEAEGLAERLSKSRSQLYSEALAEYVARHDQRAVTRAYDAVCEAFGCESSGFGDEAARRLLERVEW